MTKDLDILKEQKDRKDEKIPPVVNISKEYVPLRGTYEEGLDLNYVFIAIADDGTEWAPRWVEGVDRNEVSTGILLSHHSRSTFLHVFWVQRVSAFPIWDLKCFSISWEHFL
ncbi:hypothetical protein M0804_009718 [Polistes exclamans]|nr:hypothetical protein M0804_009718 [Polistes exclamans]